MTHGPPARRKTEDGEEDELPPPPDGGWGWVVVFGSFMVHVISELMILKYKFIETISCTHRRTIILLIRTYMTDFIFDVIFIHSKKQMLFDVCITEYFNDETNRI